VSAESFSDLATQLDEMANTLFVTSQPSTTCHALRRAAAALREAGPVLDAADAWITAEIGFTAGDTSARALYDAKSTLARAVRGRRSPTPPPTTEGP
jgi:hypothetical protein